MVIAHDFDQFDCESLEEYRARLLEVMAPENSEIWISEHGVQDECPCLAILIKGERAVINLWDQEGHNFVSQNPESASIDDSCEDFCEGEYEVACEQIITKSAAMIAALDFFESGAPTNKIIWNEL